MDRELLVTRVATASARAATSVVTLLAVCGAVAAQAAPVCLASLNSTLYRVNAAGPGVVETFPGQPGTIVSMTLVPHGVAVAGCGSGDVLAVEGVPGGKLWRVDNAPAGPPSLVHLGSLPAGVSASSIVFASGKLLGIDSVADVREFDPLTFAQVGPVFDYTVGAQVVGGLAFDGTSKFYVTNSSTNAISTFTFPLTGGVLSPLGNTGVDHAQSGLEFWSGELWAGLYVGTGLQVGTVNVQSGVFTKQWDVATAPSGPLGLVVLDRVWTDLGFGLAGSAGTPKLVGAGSLTSGSTGSLTLSFAKPASVAALFASASSAPASFKGGTLVPVPPLVMLVQGTLFGTSQLSWASWPSGVPVHTSLYFQYAVQDAAAIHGVALSNALEAVTP